MRHVAHAYCSPILYFSSQVEPQLILSPLLLVGSICVTTYLASPAAKLLKSCWQLECREQSLTARVYTTTVVHRLRYLVSCTLFAKGLNWITRGLKVSRPLVVSVLSFVNLSNFFN